jgi:hypothetical protein
VTWEIDPQEGASYLLTSHPRPAGRRPKTAESVADVGWMMVLSGLNAARDRRSAGAVSHFL